LSIRQIGQALLAFAIAATGQAMAQSPPAGAEACASIETDAGRLACYDAAFGRGRRDPREADLAAGKAERARAAGDLYRQDDSTAQAAAAANAGKGSLLDSRWELAKDSKLGTFNFRAYKPVYLLPLTWTDSVNTTPTSRTCGASAFAATAICCGLTASTTTFASATASAVISANT